MATQALFKHKKKKFSSSDILLLGLFIWILIFFLNFLLGGFHTQVLHFHHFHTRFGRPMPQTTGCGLYLRDTLPPSACHECVALLGLENTPVNKEVSFSDAWHHFLFFSLLTCSMAGTTGLVTFPCFSQYPGL